MNYNMLNGLCRTALLTIACVVISPQSLTAQEVTFFTPSVVRIVKNAPDISHDMGLSFVVMAEPEKVDVKKTTTADETIYTSAALTVKVSTKTGQVCFYDTKGNVLLREGETSFMPIVSGPDKGRYAVGQSFALDKDEPIYGVGLLQNGKMNQRGEHRLMMQTNLEDYSHFFQSIKGYGVYWDNYSPTRIDDDGELKLESQVGCKVDYYFMYGGNADGVIGQMRALTGRVPMLPLWTYGFHQSRERYKSAEELMEVVGTYRKTGIPFDGIIQDWQYWGNNYLWNAMEFLSEGFAKNSKKMIDFVHEQNAHLSISIWASFGPHTKGYAQLASKGLLYDFETWPRSGLSQWPPNMDYPSGVRCYDPYSAESRSIYWENLSRLYAQGIDAWWMDSTDPDHHSFKESDLDQVRLISNPATSKDIMGSWRSVRNAFPLCTVEGVYENQRKTDKTKRVFILTRSYFAGQQRTGANTWSGDVSSSWDSFRKQVPICLNFTMTANPNVNTDIGGFFANKYNKHFGDNSATQNPLFQELYVRWMQFGLFCPMMRSHGTEVYRELYYYGKPGEAVYDALISAVKMRYEILPYVYSLSWQVSSANGSFMRPLVMDFKDDKNVWDNNREFMFGNAFLVAPVVNALFTPETANETNEISGWDSTGKTLFQEGFKADWTAHKTYDVYLPKGSDWFDFWTFDKFQGGQTIKADAPISHSPLFVRAGSIVPLCKSDSQYANIADWKSLDIVVYPGANASFTLYEDEGDGYAYEQGEYSTIHMKWNERKRTLEIGKRQGSFSRMIDKRIFKVQLLNGKAVEIAYDGKAKTVRL